MQVLLLIRGAPGAGKSTLAQALVKSGLFQKHFEADQWFTTPNGKYHYDRSKLSAAHAWCIRETRRALADGHSVVVSNCFTQDWQTDPYFEIVDDLILYHGKFIELQQIYIPVPRFDNIHGVPHDKVMRMEKQLQETMKEWF